MAKEPAPVSVTGGAGFSFEDAVAASFMTHMLSASRYLGADFGSITCIEFQVRDRGWLLDDLLIHFGSPVGPRHLALSLKSDRQVTRNGFPPDFVQTVWEQWLGTPSGTFQEDRDVLALAVGDLAGNIKSAWDQMLGEALATDPGRLARRFRSGGHSSRLKRALFRSLRCPSDLKRSGASDAPAAARLLAHIRLMHFDFQATPSHDLARALSLCQSIVESEAPTNAAGLWERLIGIAAERRRVGGTLDLSGLLGKLRLDFRLKPYPDHRSDWERIERASRAAADRIRDQVSDGIKLDRSQLRCSVIKQLENAPVVVLVGESGCGKSAVAKDIAFGTECAELVVWLSAELMDADDLARVRSTLGLCYDLVTVLNNATASRCLLVLDAIDRFSPRALACAADLLRTLLPPQGSGRCPWSVLFTSDPAGWDRVGPQLFAKGVDPRLFKAELIGLPSDADVRGLLGRIPSLKHAANRRELRSLLQNLKILDWVAIAAATRNDVATRAWVGLSELMDCVWDYWIGSDSDRLARAGVLKKLAQIDGAGLVAAMPLSALDQTELRTLGAPELSHLVRDEEERIRFTHDLVGDWARVRVLIGEPAISRALIERATLPRWHRAIRFYGQRLLEQHPDSTSVWRTTIDQCAGEDTAPTLARDLLLESAFFAVNAGELLERVWPDLTEHDGLLLKRLLKSFWHSATFPDPRIAGIAATQAEAGRLAAMMRVPYGPYWLPVLCLLRRHVDEVVKLPSLLEVAADVCLLWLRTTPPEIQPGEPCPGRQEAAEVAVKLAREVQALKAEGVHFHDGADERVYEAMLHAAPDLPKEVSELALELIRRGDPAPEILARAEEQKRREQARQRELEGDPEYVERVTKLALTCGIGPLPRGPLRAPWPDGPRERVDSAFQKVCLNNAAAFQALIQARPAVAREVLLAVCIEPPQHEDPYGYASSLIDNLGTVSWIEGFPAIYFRGPFLQFLRLSPGEGVEFVLRLVNFATERWSDSARRYHRRYEGEEAELSLTVNVPLERGHSKWLGNDHVYRWYRFGSLEAACVTNSLMALERWLYEQIDAGRDVGTWINTILERSRSVAFAGVLAAVGCKQVSLFEGPLQRLLGIWQVFSWELTRLANADIWRIEETTWWQQGGDTFLKLAREWHSLAHRGIHLRDVAASLLLTRPDMGAYFERVRKLWHEQLATLEDKESLELLIARFDPTNYRRVRQEDGQEYLVFEWPAHLREATESAAREAAEHSALMHFPLRCRMLLDKGEPLDEEGLKAFWTTFHSLVERVSDRAPDRLVRYRADAICGGVAVLVILHRDWLRADVERETWCRDRLDAVLAEPPAELEFSTPESTYPLGWDRFAAECSVTFLSESPSDADLRELVAASIAGVCYETTSYAMRTAFRVRHVLGSEFVSLQNFAVLWAGLRCIMHSARRWESDMTRWERWRGRLIDAFRDSRMPTQPLRWERAARIARTVIHRIESQRFPRIDDVDEEPDRGREPAVATGSHRRKSGRSTHPGLDVQVIQAVFSWIPTLNQARDGAERRAWIGLLHEALGVTLSMLPEVSDADDELRGTPYEYDRWVFERLAAAVAQMSHDEKPELLWQPILDLGGSAHDWISSFLSAWFIYGARAAPSPIAFVDRWREMIDHTLASPRWSQPNSWLGFRLADVMTELMGLSWHGRSVGEPEYADAIATLRPQFETFSQRWLSVPRVAAHFASFLTRPAAGNVLCDGVRWLHAAVSNYDHYDWRDDGLEDSLVEALRACWVTRAHDVQNDPVVREAFLNLLGILVRRQNRAAFGLRDEVTHTLGG